MFKLFTASLITTTIQITCQTPVKLIRYVAQDTPPVKLMSISPLDVVVAHPSISVISSLSKPISRYHTSLIHTDYKSLFSYTYLTPVMHRMG